MKIFKYSFIAFILAVSGVTYAYANVVRLVLIDYSDFRKVDESVYVSSELPDDAEEKIAALLSGARKRIAFYYGKPNADPVIVALGSQKELKSYGLYDSPGSLLFAPWNTYLLLNYQTAGIDVTSHELVHAEVVQRVGYLKRQTDIPTWFDEGVAMQVDYRSKYDSIAAIDQAEFLRLTSLDTPDKFWSQDKHQNVQNYRTAKLAVAEMLKQSDENLYSILADIRSGEKAVIASVVHETNKALQRTSR